MLTAPPKTNLPSPPRLHWAWVLALSILTLGLFTSIWLLIQGSWVSRVRGQSRGQLFTIYFLAVLAFTLLADLVVIFTGHGRHSALVVLSLILLRLVSAAFWFTALFTLRNEMQIAPISLPLSGVMTFFFGPIYFQYELQDFDTTAAAIDSTTDTERTPEADYHELITLIDELDDERAKARFRESIYIAIIIWLCFFALVRFAPQYFRGPRLVAIERPRNEKQTTIAELPPDQVKKLVHPKPTPNIAQRSQEAESPKPSPETPKPAPNPPAQQAQRPAPQPQQAAPQQTAPQQQPQQQQQPAQPRPQPSQQSPLVDSPKPQQTKPNFNMNNRSPGEQIAQAARNARNGSSGGGDYGAGPTRNGGGRMGTQILSDTQGVDFSKYLARLLHDVKRNWDPLIPDECRPPLLKQGITGIRFTIQRDGTITGMNLDYSTHDNAINKSAWGSITSLGAAQPLPPEFKGNELTLRIEFRVNKDGADAQ